MTRIAYDARHAKALVPLLRSITNEIQERTRVIARLEQSQEDGLEEPTRLDAELSIQRRELRFAVRELERLGCRLDQDHPLRVLIPGEGGKLDPGFVWSPLDETANAV